MPMPTYLHVLTLHVLSASTTIPRVLAVSVHGARVVDSERLGDPVVLTVEELDAFTQPVGPVPWKESA